MRGRLIITACGLMLTVALGAPIAAQAAVTRPGPAGARTTAAVPDTTLRCGPIDDLGNNHYAGWDSSFKQDIYFGVDLAHAIPYCNINRGNGRFWIDEEINGQASGECLISDPIAGAGELPCSDAMTDWTANKVGTYHSQSIWEFTDTIDLQCLYDYKQDPAIESNCNASNAFEHFIWDALP